MLVPRLTYLPLQELGITFIGPPSGVMAAHGYPSRFLLSSGLEILEDLGDLVKDSISVIITRRASLLSKLV